MITMCMLAMMATSLSVKAQEITVTLLPGWTWISYTRADTLDIATAMGSFTPTEGDKIKSQYAFAEYHNGVWAGSLTQFCPGLGYMYKSNRTMPATLSFNAQQPAPQVVVTTSEPMLITAISAMGGGEVTVNDGTYILAKGLCWATHENPTTNEDYFMDAGNGVGNFTGSITNLNISTTYFVRAYAVTADGTFYGEQRTFTTRDGIPTLTTIEVTNITGATATCGGDITDNGGLNVISRGVCWSTAPNPTVNDSHTSNGSGSGIFSSNITDLSVSTTYYVRAYAITNAGTAYGEAVNFTTRDGIPTLTTNEITNIIALCATSGGNITDDGGLNVIARGVCWSTSNNPTLNDNHTTNGEGSGSFTSSITGLSFSTTYYVRAYASNNNCTIYGEEVSFTSDNGWADLGLPSGTLWATCNVGADAPEDYGDYFAWGETVPKDYYDWSTYQYGNGGFYDEYGFHPYLTKYCNNSEYGYNGYTDNLTILLLEDDAATANWGSDWRMPTKEEFQELYNNTTVTWTTQNGVNGGLFTASNGNSLFLPAAGFRSSSGLNYAGSHGYYWSSSLYTDSPKFARYFGVYSDSSYGMGNSNGGRNCGRPVRAVRSGTTNYSITVSSIPTFGGTVTGGGTYQQGQSCTVIATANSNYTFMNWTENNEVVSTNASYTFTVSGNRTLVANFTYNGGGSDHDYVDLGLPSGTMWATCNVGANVPEDYGDYFAWGETQPKNNYYWNTYQYCNGGDGWNTLTKYCSNFSYGYNGFTDNLTYLQSGDDVATVNWGENWRMPTKIEWQELYNNTTCTWATQNGVNGRLFTASNGNSLFIPAAGYGDSNGPNAIGNMGDYWSRTLNPSFPYYAYGFYFDSGGFTVYDSYRDGGLCVRPVRAQQGAINGLFSVSDTQQVYFSQGNLQYQASSNTWRFAENQWDYVGTHTPTPENNGFIGGTVIGSDNHNISSTYSGWIDLFGWGTSGYHDSSDPYNVNYQPWSTSWSTVNENYNYYGYGPSTNMSSPNLTGTSANYDWGIYNPISNGGNTSNQWRTLTQSEWTYVFFDRVTVSGIRYAKAKVNNVNGVILLPDNWSNSTYNLNDTNTDNASFNSNILTISEWATIEDTGAVFLPVEGYRSGNTVYCDGSYGYYWSASYSDNYGGCILYISDFILFAASSSRPFGFSVRLVRNAE